MARRKESSQKVAMREMMRGYLKDNNIRIKDGTDVNAVMRDRMSVLLESVLDEELDACNTRGEVLKACIRKVWIWSI